MKQRHLPLIIILTFFIQINVAAQNTDTLSYHQRLYHLGKVWGYAKYFHPKVASCSVDWDQTLFSTIAKIKSAAAVTDFNQILLEMLDQAGTIPTSNTSNSLALFEKDQTYNLNLDWFNTPIFEEGIKQKLALLRDNYKETSQCKIRAASGAGNPNLSNDTYLYKETSSYPTEPERILAIFRYWNIINYFFPYKYQMDQDWDLTLAQFIPPIVNAENELEYLLAFKEFTTYINDSHGFFVNNKYYENRGYNYTPFLMKTIENQTVISKVHDSVKDKISVGDIVLKLDNEPIEILRERWRKITEGSNEPTINRNINSNLIYGEGGRFNLTVKNESGEKEVELIRRQGNTYASMFGNTGTSYEVLSGSGGCEVGYIDMELLERGEVPAMFEAFNDLPAIIVDIRNYPQGTLWEMVDYLYESSVNFAAFTIPHSRYPGILNFRQHSIGRGGATPYKGKLVLLFDEETQSQAEFTIMGLEKHPNALKIGSQTAGADGNISDIKLPGGIKTYFSGLGVFYPDGRETQRIGIVPDIEFHPTIEGVRAGRDEMLEFALDCQLLDLVRPEFEDGNGLNVFPNPTDNLITIQSQYNTNYSIQITDIAGRFIEGFKIDALTPTYDLNFSFYHKGIYLLTFRDKNGVFATEKVVKL